MTPFDVAVRRADTFRDQGCFAEAAEAYQAVLTLDPLHSGLWVQFGNMLKDCGQHDRAIDAYDRALILTPDDVDVRLQRGRAQRLWGRHADALHSFKEVLERVPAHADAIGELIRLGEGWVAGQTALLGPRLLLDVLDATARMRDLIAQVEIALPTIRALTTAPLEQYDAFRRAIRVPSPSRPAPNFGLSVVMSGDGPLDVVLRIIRALQDQTHQTFAVAMPDLSGEAAIAFARLATSRPDRFVALSPGPTSALVSAMPAQPGLVLTWQLAVLDPEALAWVAASLASEGTSGVLCDEETVDYERGESRYSQPFLRGRCDPEMLEQGVDAGSVLAGRTAMMIEALRGSDRQSRCLADVALALTRFGRVDVIRQPLAGCPGGAERAVLRRKTVALPCREDPIAVIIPTRNRLDCLAAAIAAARDTARAPGRLRFVVVDNGSTDTEMQAYLRDEAGRGRLSHLRVDEPFNWSRLNRLGASAADDVGTLVFMNNDVTLTGFGWDDQLAALLERPEVGVVGVKLLYPDGIIQHAGVLATKDGLTEHDGRGKPNTDPGPGGRYALRRCVTAVTGAFLATRRDTFEMLGGFDEEAFPLWFNDVDYCLKAWAADLRVLYDPAICGLHSESRTLSSSFARGDRDTLFEHASRHMGERWGQQMRDEPWSRVWLEL